jgi:hypothetical protein
MRIEEEGRGLHFPELPDGSKVSGTDVFQELISLINPDGTVSLPLKGKGHKVLYPNPRELSVLSPEDLSELQISYARTLYRHIKYYYWPSRCGDRPASKLCREIEPRMAQEYASLLHEPGFLSGIPKIVDEVLSERLHYPSIPDSKYPTIY